MRNIMDPQMKIGEIDIPKIKFDLRSRDEIPQLLMGLQKIYSTPEAKEKIFSILKNIIPPTVNTKNGRPGMNLWKIFVLGTIRLICNWDFDKLLEMGNNHRTLRKMLGHGILDDDYNYSLQTLKDNLSLFTSEILDKINAVIVKAGHNLLSKLEIKLKAKIDSFVVETDVHYPTDINLLFDAIRKIIELVALCCHIVDLSGWRKSKSIIRKVKRSLRRIENLKRSKPKSEKKKTEKEKKIIKSTNEYIKLVNSLLENVRQTLSQLEEGGLVVTASLLVIKNFIEHAERQIDQIKRRVIDGKKIPHEEKVFSIFEEHTEWISKGKAGVPQELGLRVCIVEDQHGFILTHKVMEKETDDKIAVSIIEDAKNIFPNLSLCSFDKGFYSPENKENLSKMVDTVILPKKGKLSEADKEIEHSEEFIEARHKHSAVESGINALENHGLDRCLDHGIDGFKRYVAFAVVARNIQILGKIVLQKKIKSQKIKEKLEQTRKHYQLQDAA